MQEIIIPFEGFFKTHHGYSIQDVVRRYGKHTGYSDSDFDYNLARTIYAASYVKTLSLWLNIEIRYKQVEYPFNPKELTELIVGIIPSSSLDLLCERCAPEKLNELIEREIVPSSKYKGRYSTDSFEWGDYTKWDKVQLGFVLQTVTDAEMEPGWSTHLVGHPYNLLSILL